MEKIELIHNQSSLHKLNYKIGQSQIYMKRDNTLDFAFGGNKVRLFEYIAAVIKKANVDKIITYGSIYSNYVRVAAAVCAKMHIGCDIIMLDEGENLAERGNALLLKQYDVKIVHCPLKDAHDFIDEYQEQQRDKNYLWIPGGGHIPEAAFGYVDAAREILQQADELGVIFDAVFLPCGTGTTQVGLIHGFSNQCSKVIGVSIARTVGRCVNEIKDLLNLMKLSDGTMSYSDQDIMVLDNMGIKYGHINENIVEVSRKLANTDGIFLDPVYNAKAFYGMKQYLDSHSDLQKVLYINTGGLPIFLCEGGFV